MKGQKLLFSHKNDDWETPQSLFDELKKEFRFVVDIAATRENRKTEHFINNIDELYDLFDPRPYKPDFAWCNPPYSNQRKFVEFVIKHKLNSVFLLPARTDTKLFQELIYPNWSINIRNLFQWNEEGIEECDVYPYTLGTTFNSSYTTEVRFIKGRLKFKPSEQMVKEWENKLLTETKKSKIESLKTQISGEMPSGFPSMIVIFRFD